MSGPVQSPRPTLEEVRAQTRQQLENDFFGLYDNYTEMARQRDALNARLSALQQAVLDEGPYTSARVFKKAPA